MPIRAVCPEGHKILAPSSRAGQRIRCPRCRSVLQVPEVESAEPTSKAAEPEKRPATKKQRWKGDPKSEEAATKKAVSAKKPKRSAAADQPTATPPKAEATPPPRSESARKTPPPLPPSRGKQADQASSQRTDAAKLPSSRQQSEPAAAPKQAASQTTKKRKKRAIKQPAAKSAPAEPSSLPKTPSAVPPPTKRPSQSVAGRKPPTKEAPRAADSGETAEFEEPVYEEPPAEEFADSQLAVVGMKHRPERIRSAGWLAVVLAALAIFGMTPAALEWYDFFQSEGEQPLARWVWMVLCLSGLQLAYAFYLMQMPDWSSVWSVAIATLASAMLYAMLYAVTSFAGSDSEVLSWLQIHATQAGRASGWCFVMLCLTGIYAYFSGRSGAAWRHSEQLRTSLGLNS